MSPKEFIENLQKEKSDFKNQSQINDITNSLNTISSDIYSDANRFVYELLQNADDAAVDGSNEITINRVNNCLVLSHNGKIFSEQDIIALTSVGISTKAKDITKIGFKGIGFKSVFSRSELVAIFSGNYFFKFEKKYHSTSMPWQIIPIWTDPGEFEDEKFVRDLINRFQVITIVELKDIENIFQEIKVLLADARVLLFLRNISRITMFDGYNKVITMSKEIEYGSITKVKLYRDNTVLEEWILFDEEVDVPEQLLTTTSVDQNLPDKLQDATKSNLTFAAKIKENLIVPLKGSDSVLYAYLPTKVTALAFPFLVNTDFVTNASREALREDLAWNHWLIEECAKSLLKWIAKLSRTTYKSSMLLLLPQSSLNNSKLATLFFKKIKEAALSIPFCPTSNNNIILVKGLVSDKSRISNVGIIELRKFLSYLGRVKSSYLKDDCFLDNSVDHSEKLEFLGSHSFENKDLLEFLKSTEFQTGHKLHANITLLQYLRNICEFNDRKSLCLQLKDIPFIMDHREKLQKPGEVAYRQASEAVEFYEELSLLHPDVQSEIDKEPDLHRWLTELGLSETSDRTYLSSVLLPKIEEIVTIKNAFVIVKYIMGLFNRGVLTKSDLDKLRKLPLVLKNSVMLKEAESCYLPDSYGPILCLERKNLPLNFISENYAEESIQKSDLVCFFTAIGVKQNIWVENVEKTVSELKKSYNFEWINYTKIEAMKNPNGYYGFGDSNKIKFEEIALSHLMDSRAEISEIIWDYLFSLSDNIQLVFSRALRRFGSGTFLNFASYPVTSFIPWALHFAQIAPTTKGELRRVEETFLNTSENLEIAGDYLPVFFWEREIPLIWQKYLHFKSSMGIADLLFVLSSLAKQGVVKNLIMKQVDVIYEKIISMLPKLTQVQIESLQDWSNNNYLLNQKREFKKPKELFFIPAAFVIQEEDADNLVYLPKSIQKNNEIANQFCELFGIGLLDDFKPFFKEPNSEPKVKDKIFTILPLMVFLKSSENPIQTARDFLELISRLQFFSVEEIVVEIFFADGTVFSSKISTYRTGEMIYFIGRWNKVLNIEEISNEVCKMIDSEENVKEFRDLLSMEDDERLEFTENRKFDKKILEEITAFIHSYLGWGGTDIHGSENSEPPFSLLVESDPEPPADRILENKKESAKYFSDIENKSFEDKLIELVNIPDTHFEKGYVYHYTHVENAAEIIKSGKLNSRTCANIKGFKNSASIHQLDITRNFVHDHVRFYFRPLTPTQYYNEGLGRQYGEENPNCPVPVFFRISLSKILKKYKEKLKISNGNLSSSWARVGNSYAFLRDFNFLSLYSEFPHIDYKHASQQELIVKDFVSLEELEYEIICRNESDKETLLSLLEGQVEKVISVRPEIYYNRNPYIKTKFDGINLNIQLINADNSERELGLLVQDGVPSLKEFCGYVTNFARNTGQSDFTILLNNEKSKFYAQFQMRQSISLFLKINQVEERLIYLGPNKSS